MGVKRIVDTDFWADIDVIDNFSIDDKFFALYLYTNKHTRQSGIYKLPKKYISFETGFTKEVIEVLLDRFENQYKRIKYNHKTQEIALLRYTAFSIVKGGKPVEECIIRDLRTIKDKGLIKATCEEMEDTWKASTRAVDEKVKEIFFSFINENDNDNENENDNDNENDNENENENETIVGVSPNDSYHDSYNDSSSSKNKYYKNIDLDDAVKEFIKHRKTLRKPMTPAAVKAFTNKLDREFKTDEEKIEAINYAILRGWLSVEKAWIDNAKRSSGSLKTIEQSQKEAEERWGEFLNA